MALLAEFVGPTGNDGEGAGLVDADGEGAGLVDADGEAAGLVDADGEAAGLVDADAEGAIIPTRRPTPAKAIANLHFTVMIVPSISKSDHLAEIDDREKRGGLASARGLIAARSAVNGSAGNGSATMIGRTSSWPANQYWRAQ